MASSLIVTFASMTCSQTLPNHSLAASPHQISLDTVRDEQDSYHSTHHFCVSART